MTQNPRPLTPDPRPPAPDSRPRILVVGPYPSREGTVCGGVEAVTLYLTEGLAARGDLDVHVLTCVAGLGLEQERVTPAGARVHLIPYWGRFGCLTGFVVDVARLRSAAARIRADLVHVHGQTHYARAFVGRDLPSVLTPHGVFYKEAGLARGLYNRLQAGLACWYERQALRRAPHVILLNRYQKEAFASYLGRATLHFIDNPIDDRFFEIGDRREPGAVLFLGTIRRRKGLVHLARAASILRARGAQFGVSVVGPEIEKEYAEEVKRYVAENDLMDRFEFAGSVSEAEVDERYARCSVLALPSFEETAPMVIAQAQAAGKPVVATAVGGVPEMVADGVNGFLVPFADAEALAEKIGRLISDPELARRMGEAGRAEAEKRYRRSAVVEKTVAVYREVLRVEG